ncbi:MAG: hypothetical protein KAJ33_08745 [Thermoplasmata archaeon]|nr:hypothetical protein [Thermoplasmata archaeon]
MRGSRVRAPVSGKANVCQHITNRKQSGIEIIMECEMCKDSGLKFIGCYKGVLKALQIEGMASTIILRSHIERRYDTRSTKVMNQLAEILNRSDEIRSQMLIDSRRGEKCSGCLKPLIDKLGDLNKSVLARRITGAVRQINLLPEFNFRHGRDCGECSGMIMVQLTSISKMANSLEKDILAGAYNIVEVGK